MYYQNRFLDAVDTVLGWDLPDEALPEAVNELALLMAGLDPEAGRGPD